MGKIINKLTIDSMVDDGKMTEIHHDQHPNRQKKKERNWVSSLQNVEWLFGGERKGRYEVGKL